MASSDNLRACATQPSRSEECVPRRRHTFHGTLFQPSARAETSQPGQASGVLGSPRDRKSEPSLNCSFLAEDTKPALADPEDPFGHLCAPNYAPGTNPAGGVAVFGRDFTTQFRFALIRTRPNRSTSWACARSAAGIHASHVSSGRSRFGSGRSSSRRCTSGAASNHTCVITTSRADDRFVTFTK
jgi:hypothetical protein